MIREIKGYFWGDDDIPIKKDDHSLDELRYYIMSIRDSPEKIETSSDMLCFKDNLSKRIMREKRKNFFR